MYSIPLTVGPQKADIGLALSAAITAQNPVGSETGRGLVQLFNSDDNAAFYLAFGDTEPGADVAGIPVPIGGRFPDDLQITPNGGVWAWSNKTGTRLQAVIAGWS